MQFAKCEYPKNVVYNPSPRKRAAAKRAINRLKEKGGMFPGAQETVDQRMQRIHQENLERWRRFRAYWAKEWRLARKIYYGMSKEDREKVRQEWTTRGKHIPRDPAYFLEFMRGMGFKTN